MMMEPFSKKSYQKKVEAIFTRFPSVQKVPFKDAYKPGLENMLRFEEVLGNPHNSLRTIHVAGTNGKGSAANMLASALAACGLKVGLLNDRGVSVRRPGEVVDVFRNALKRYTRGWA